MNDLLVAAIPVAGALLLIYGWRRRRQSQVVEEIERHDKPLRSERLNLSGQPDQLLRLRSGAIIPVDKKLRPKTKRRYHGFRLQLGAYLLLVEEEFGRRPPYGKLVIGGRTHWIRNTDALRWRTRHALETLRRMQVHLDTPVGGVAKRKVCKHCGFRDHCEQGQHVLGRRWWWW